MPDPQLRLDEIEKCAGRSGQPVAGERGLTIILLTMTPALPWFANGNFPLYLAPMAGVSDKIFRQLCKSRGADVLVTEFVSAEGVFRRNERTRGYLEFDEIERPIGVQLFGGNAEHMAEAARQVVDWVAA